MASIATPIDPTSIQPRHDRILCTRYERPAFTPGGLHIPASFLIDPYWTWWEVVASGPEVEKKLGCRLHKGDLIKIATMRPAIDLGHEDLAGRRLYMVSCEVEMEQKGKMKKIPNIAMVWFNTWDPATDS